MGIECLEGYKGRLCHQCVLEGDAMFTRQGKHECVKCPSPSENAAKVIGLALLVLLYISILIL
jgi:hypothetical protein